MAAKLRILCLHGYRQNETIFRERTGALRKLLKREAEFVFVSAPHVIPEPENLEKPPEEQERGWFFSRPERGYKGIDQTDLCIGLEDTIDFLDAILKTQSPFDGVLGFSQGACLLSLILTHFKSTHSVFDFKFAMFFSGFKSLLTPHRELYSTCCSIECPSFHTIGETDGIIPSQMSVDLSNLFNTPTVYTHNGGHFIPASPDLRRALQDFLRPFFRN